MERIGNRLSMIGTVHVDPGSAATVRDTIIAMQPEVVALELDEGRMMALENPRARRGRGAGVSFLTMALLERFAGQLTGSPPGTEMLEAVKTAQLVGARVAFIDMPITNTGAGLRNLPWTEKVKLMVDVIASLVVLPFSRIDWSEVPEDLDSQIASFRKRYPILSGLLIDKREEYMISQLKRVMETTTGQVLAVVGFGHRASLARALEGYMKGPRLPPAFHGTSLQVHDDEFVA